jgi:hypothetical protein
MAGYSKDVRKKVERALDEKKKKLLQAAIKSKACNFNHARAKNIIKTDPSPFG